MAAVNDIFAITENQTLTGNLFDGNGGVSDTDTSANGMSIVSFLWNGNTYAAGVTVDIGGGGTLTVNSDGSFTLVPGALFDPIAEGASPIFQFSYTNDEGESANVDVTVDGVNDAPTVVPTATVEVPENGSVSGQIVGSDVDDGASLNYYIVGGTPVGFALEPDGSYTYDAAHQGDIIPAGGSQDYSVVVRVDDGQGGFADQSLTFTIVGANDAPVAVDGSADVAEDGSVAGSFPNASDPDVGATWTYELAGDNPNGMILNSDGSYLFNASGFDSLAAGETQDVVFNYVVRDDQGVVSATQTFTITVTGTNDAPVLSGPVLITATEDAITNGSVPVATDADSVVDHYELVGAVPVGLTFNSDGTYSFDASSYDSLAGGATQDFNIAYVAVDAEGAVSGSGAFNINITGVNDAPVVTATTNSVIEDGFVVGSLPTATDVDNGSSIASYQLVGAAPTGLTLGIMGSPTAYVFDASSYDYLAEGETEEIEVQYTATDNRGATSAPQTLTFTITGTNDAPTVYATTGSVNEDASTSGNVSASDVDDAIVSYELTGGVPTGFSINAATGEWTFDASSYDYIAEGDELEVTADYMVTDAFGDTSTSTITVTVTGTNDGPVAGAATTLSVAEDSNGSSFVLPASDVDGTIVSYQLTGAAPTGLVFNTDGSYTFDASNFDHLADGETEQVVVSYTATDDSGATSAAQTLTITITGTNDAPTVYTAGGSVDEGASTSGNVSASDVDDAIVSYELTGEVPTGFSINAATGDWTFDASGYDYLAEGAEEDVSVSYMVTDDFGGTSSSTITVTVTGTNDAPVASASSGSVNEDATTSGSVSATDADEGAVLSYSLNAAAPTGLEFNSDGSWTFDAASYDSLAAGATQVFVIGYTATDEEGGSSTANLTITITGTNDVPVVTAATGATTEGHAVSGNVPAATDVDSGSSIVSYQLTAAAPAGLVFNPNGTWTFSGAGYDGLTQGQTANLVVNYTATDNLGGVSAPQTLTITITGIAGTSGNDTIYGTAGDDTLEGGAGTDNIYGGLGNDTFIGNVDGVGDAYRGEGGSDTVDYSAATGAMNINLNNAASGGGVGTDQLYSIENVIATAYGDTISGNASDNRIVSGLGNDTINGNGGVDTVVINANATTGMAVQGAFNLTVTSADGVDVLRNVEFIQFNNALIRVNGVTGNAYAFGVADTNTATEDGAASTGNVLTNDIEIEGEAKSVSTAGVFVGEHGTLTINANGTYSYVATDQSLAAGEIVSDVFSYTVVDTAGEGSSASLTFTVTGTNDGPVAADGTNAATEDGMISGSVSASDVDGDNLSFALVDEAPAGLVFNSNGTYTFDASSYELNAGETQDVTFSFTVSDGQGGTDTGSYTITVTGINDSPVAYDASNSVTEDASVSGSVSAADIDGTVASYQLVGAAPTGLTFNTDGTYSFDASSYDSLAVGATQVVTATFTATDDQGAVSSTQTLSITVTGTNDVPTVTGADFGAAEDTVVNGSVSGADVDGTIVTYQLTAEGPTGLTFNSDGTYSFDASSYDSLNEGETTTVSFSYTAADNNGGVSDTDTVVITITGTNDVPVPSNAVNAVDEDSDINGQLSASDIDGDVVSYQLTGEVPEGLTLNTDGSYSFDASSYDSLADGDTQDVIATYTVTDDQGGVSDTRTLTITITGSNDAPVVSEADFEIDEDGTMSGSVAGTDVDGELDFYTLVSEAPTGLVFNSDGTYTFDASSYEQNEGESEQVQFTFTGTDNDGGVSDPVTVTITINGINDLPVASDATDEVDEDGQVNGAVGATDADGTIASYQLTAEAPLGLTFNTDGTYSFDASEYDYLAEGDTLEVVATFTATDDQGAVSAPRTLTITVTGSNDAPTVSLGDFSVNEDATVSGSVSSADVDGEVVSYALVGEAPTGLTFNSDGTYTFDASSYDSLNAGDDTTVEFTFTGTDDSGGVSDPVTVTVTVVGQNDAPVAYDATDSVDEDGSINGAVSATDEDGTVVSYQLTGEGPTGLVFNPDGSYSFDASSYDYLAEGDTEEVTATFTATDDQGIVSAPRTLTITVTGSNDAPTVSLDDFSVDEDASVSGTVSASDVDGVVVSYALTSEAPTGLTFNTDGTYTFDASSYDSLGVGESTTVEFTFTGTDDSGGTSDPETVTVTINGTNDGPVANNDTLTFGSGPQQLFNNGGFENGLVGWTVSIAPGSNGLVYVDSDTVTANSLTSPGPHSGIQYAATTQGGPGAYSLMQGFVVPEGFTSLILTFAAYTNNGASLIFGPGLDYITDSNQHAQIDLLVGGSTAFSVAGADIVANYFSGGATGLTGWTTYTVDLTSLVTVGESYDLRFAQVDNSGVFTLGVDSVSLVADSQAAPDENTTFTIDTADLLANDTDADSNDVLTVTAVSATSAEGASVTLDGTEITYNPGTALDYLAAGETVIDSFTYTISDGHGGTSTATVDFEVTGTNDGPTISSLAGGAELVEDAAMSASGSIDFGDVDATDEHDVSFEAGGMGYVGDFAVQLADDSDGDGVGEVTWTFDVDPEVLQGLAEGQTLTQTYTVTIDDGNGGTVSQDVTITITGTNDYPGAVLATNTVNEDDIINGSVSGTDVDGTIVSYQLVGEGPEGLTFNSDGTYSFDASSYDSLEGGETYDAVFTFTATDNNGAVSEEQTLTITITGSNDAPVAYDSDVEVGDGDTINGSVSASDVDGTVSFYTLTGATPDGLTFNSDGTYSFDASGFDLNIGDTETVTFTFTATDDDGVASEEQTVTITVIGAPTQVTLDDGGDSYTGTGDDEDIDGGDGDDVIFTGGGINTAEGHDGDDTITGGAGTDSLDGGDDDDFLNGGSGNDTLEGGTGDDDVNGGSGDDIVYSNLGDDILRGGSGIDTLSFVNTGAGVTINLGGTGFQVTADGTDLYQGFENVTGTAFNDTMTGNSLDNILTGGDGNDTLTGGLGNDTLIGGAGNDTYFIDAGDTVVEQVGGGTDRIFTSAASYTLSGNVENLYGQSATGQSLTGDDGANTIVGAGGNDILVGGLGGDTLIGQGGNDIMYGGTGTANTMIGGLGDDTYYVDANDTIVESADQGTDTIITTRNTYTANANVENLTFNGTGNFTGTGNVLNNTIIGGNGNDTLMGGAGNDTLNGGDGTDIARLSGLASGYSITQEGLGWRIIDTNLGDGNDGSDFVVNIETLRFGNGSTLSLSMGAAPLESAGKAGFDGPQILPTLLDDDFVVFGKDAGPQVMPGTDSFDDAQFGAVGKVAASFADNILAGSMLELLPEGGLLHDTGHHDDWMM